MLTPFADIPEGPIALHPAEISGRAATRMPTLDFLAKPVRTQDCRKWTETLLLSQWKVFYYEAHTVTEHKSETPQATQTQTQKWALFSDSSRRGTVDRAGDLWSLLYLREASTYSWLVYIQSI